MINSADRGILLQRLHSQEPGLPRVLAALQDGAQAAVWIGLGQHFTKTDLARLLANDAQKPDDHYDVAAGVEGVRWVENCVRSANEGGIRIGYQ